MPLRPGRRWRAVGRFVLRQAARLLPRTDPTHGCQPQQVAMATLWRAPAQKICKVISFGPGSSFASAALSGPPFIDVFRQSEAKMKAVIKSPPIMGGIIRPDAIPRRAKIAACGRARKGRTPKHVRIRLSTEIGEKKHVVDLALA